MLQFYFLSILLNLVTGLMLLFSDREDLEVLTDAKISSIARDETFRLVLGILTSITGFFKLLTAVRGDVPVIGDLLPALAGLSGGFILLYEFYRLRSTLDESTLPKVVYVIVSSKKYVGIACIVVSCLHFLFPTVLFI
ncbi:MAG TPA: hypothetical protein VJ861_01550 [Treponemataceae bacterium]|nr:hypothetical protein [Treponemataceae bacterium]